MKILNDNKLQVKKNIYKLWLDKLFRRPTQIIGSHFYMDTDRDISKSIFLAGTARSGTTWLADLISSQISCRLLFEPFNPDLIPEYRGFHYFQYMRPEQKDERLFDFTLKVLNGGIRHRWIDQKNEALFPKFRLIKEIRANLLLGWIKQNFPEVPLLFIVRHPCAVVLSRMELKWATDKDLQPFLRQPDLIADYLSQFLDLIERARSDEEKHAIIWCISNLVPLKQSQSTGFKIIYYEDLCTQPEEELTKILEYIHQGNGPLRNFRSDKPSSTVTVASAVVGGLDKISRWENALSKSKISKILNIVNEFGLGHLYGESTTPVRKVSNRFPV